MRASNRKSNVILTLSPAEAQTLHNLALFCVGGTDEDAFLHSIVDLIRQELEKLETKGITV